MFCLNCGVQLPDEANFCYKCANPVSTDFDSQTIYARRVEPLDGDGRRELLNELENFEQSRKSSASVKRSLTEVAGLAASALLIVVFVIAGLAIGSAFMGAKSESRQENFIDQGDFPVVKAADTNPVETKSVSQRQPKIQKQSIPPQETLENSSAAATIFNQSFHVPAMNAKSFPITFNKNVHLTGTFSAEGGKNDIDLIVVDNDGLVNFQNHTGFNSFYRSDYTSRGRVDLRLAAGTYNFIFNNTAALITSKTVTAAFQAE